MHRLKKRRHFIEIKKPCSEKLQSRDKKTGTRYCNSCAQNVIDFSGMTDDEIIRIIENGNGNLCGSFRVSQVGRQLIPSYKQRETASYPRVLATFLLLSGSGALSAQDGAAETKNRHPSAITEDRDQVAPFVQTTKPEGVIKGIVCRSKSGKPLRYCSVTLHLDTALTVYSSDKGEFEFSSMDILPENRYKISVSYRGHKVGVKRIWYVGETPYVQIKISERKVRRHRINSRVRGKF